MEYVCKPVYEKMTAATRDRRMAWWRQEKFGMFIHYGLYSVLGRHEWAQVEENFPPEEYAKLADSLAYRPGSAEQWVRLAKDAGMKYAVLTTRHHEGFSLWDSKVNPFNSVNFGPHVDIVGEFAEACRKHGLRIGFYSSLMDWHNPDAFHCMSDRAARERFQSYILELNRELLTNYGKIDILWYDVPLPMASYDGWDSLYRNQLLRELQPEILINNRSRLDEDFGTPEDAIKPTEGDWEACMTFNDVSWGYMDSRYAAPYSYTPQRILTMLNTCAKKGGNLLLNVGPRADGSLPEEVLEPLTTVGRWLEENGEAFYGTTRIQKRLSGNGFLSASRRGNTVYLWCRIWPGTPEIGIGGFVTPPERITLLSTGASVAFEAQPHRLILKNLPVECPEPHAGVAVFKLEFAHEPEYIYASRYPQLHRGETYL